MTKEKQRFSLHTLFCLMIIAESIYSCLPNKIYLHGCLYSILFFMTLLANIQDAVYLEVNRTVPHATPNYL